MIRKMLSKIVKRFNKTIDWFIPLGDLFIRCWVAKIFIYSGLQKISNWTGSELLFRYEYHVLFLPPELSTILAIFIEIGISGLLVLGLGGRIPAIILFMFNCMAVYSYPFLWTPAGYVGMKDHIYWGLLLLTIILHGTGKISLDWLIMRASKPLGKI